jgi:hypothetical protein
MLSRNEGSFANGIRDMVKVVEDIKLQSWRWGMARRSIKICLFYEWCCEPGICFCWSLFCALCDFCFRFLLAVLFGLVVWAVCLFLFSCVLDLSGCIFWYFLYLVFNKFFALFKKKKCYLTCVMLQVSVIYIRLIYIVWEF